MAIGTTEASKDLRSFRLWELRRLEDHAARVVQRSWRSFQQRRWWQARPFLCGNPLERGEKSMMEIHNGKMETDKNDDKKKGWDVVK